MPSPTSRPRRAAKPTARRAAAAPPSTAPARVNKKQQRKSGTAVTAALVGRAARARSVPAQEEVVEQVVEKEAAPAVPERSQQRVAGLAAAAAAAPVLFRYSAQWILRHTDGSQLQAGGDFHNTDVVDEAYTTANAAVDRGIAKHPNTMLVRKHLSAGYIGLAERQWVPATFTPQGWSFLVEHLKEWHVAGKRTLTLKAVVIMRDIEVADVGREDEPAAAANTSRGLVAATPTAAPRARNAAVVPGQRNTATNRALARLASEQDALQVAGNWSSTITERWTCTSRACAFHRKGLCYWTIANEPTHYVPIIKAVLETWAAGIRDGDLSAAAPTPEMYGLIMAAKYEGQIASARGSSSKGSGVIVNVNQPSSPASAAPPPSLPIQSSSGKVYSSPVRLPSDPLEMSDLEQLDYFFA
jgi:hypothetical protein